MARRVVVLTTCDLCGDPDTTTLRMPNDSGRTKELDLCATHWTDLGIGHLLEVLADYGHDPDPDEGRPAPTADARAHGDHWCILCDKRLSTPSGINLHQARDHGLGQGRAAANAAAVYGQHAGTCPLCGTERASAQSVTRHAQSVHADVLPAHPSVHSLWLAAHQAGDPHGLVALVRKEHRADQ